MRGKELPNLKVMDFVSDMGAAYHAADLVVSRAGASSISEFQLIGKPVILVPSPMWRRTTSARMPWLSSVAMQPSTWRTPRLRRSS